MVAARTKGGKCIGVALALSRARPAAINYKRLDANCKQPNLARVINNARDVISWARCPAPEIFSPERLALPFSSSLSFSFAASFLPTISLSIFALATSLLRLNLHFSLVYLPSSSSFSRLLLS